MFFLITGGQKEKKLDYEQMSLCKECGKYGYVSVYKTYSHLSLFFIPVLRWNAQYYVKMECCDAVALVSNELGKSIEKGTVNNIDLSTLHFQNAYYGKRCHNCGYVAQSDYEYCPKCGCKL